MLRLKVFLFISFIPSLNYSQADSLIPSDKLKEDFSIYRASLEEAHPGLYWYRTKEEMDSVFISTQDRLNEPLTGREFFTLLSSNTAKIGCLHTVLRISKAFEEANINIDARPFPLEIKLDGNKMFVYQNLGTDTTIVRGEEIVSINGREVSSLVPFLVDKISNDGYGDAWSRYALERSFRYYYHVFFGQPASFHLKIRDQNGVESLVEVPGRLEKDRYEVLKRRYPNAKTNEPVISLKFDQETKSAILRVTRLDNWKIENKKYKFRKVLKEKMNEMLAANVDNLILDMGDRGGGNELWGLEILSYLIDKPYVPYKAVEFKTLDFSTSKKYSNTSWLEYNLVMLYLSFYKADSTYNWKNYRGLKPIHPKKERFTGNVYLLVGGATASATSDFASWIDELNLATIIGTETGGSYAGNTSNWEFEVELPNSKFRLNLPLARYLNNVTEKELGRGVIPSYIVPSSINDKLNDIDTQLNYTLDLVKD